MELDRYLGRIVRLNKETFHELVGRHRGHALANCFLVAEISSDMRQLICYGGNLRIAVNVPEVALI